MKFAGFDNEPKNVLFVWVLNLVPALGLGLLYGAGPKSLKLLFLIWLYEFVAISSNTRFADQLHVLIQTYIFMSLLGTVYACVHNVKLSGRRQLAAGTKNKANLAGSVGPGGRINVPCEEDCDADVQALDSFRRKAQEAEEWLKRRNEQVIDVSPREASPEVWSGVVPPKSPRLQEEYLQQAELSFAPPALEEVVNFPRGDENPVDELAAIPTTAENQFAEKEDGSEEPLSVEEWLKEPLNSVSDGDDFSKSAQTDPESESAIEVFHPSADAAVPTEPSEIVELHDVPLQSTENLQPANEASSPYLHSSQVLEETVPNESPQNFVVADQLSDPIALDQESTPSVPLPGSQELVQQFIGKLGDTVGTSYQQEPLSKPSFDLSFPNFEPPKFNFDFSSALSSDYPSALSSTETTDSKSRASKDHCPRCGSAKQSDFSFCLKCGISF